MKPVFHFKNNKSSVYDHNPIQLYFVFGLELRICYVPIENYLCIIGSVN